MLCSLRLRALSYPLCIFRLRDFGVPQRSKGLFVSCPDILHLFTLVKGHGATRGEYPRYPAGPITTLGSVLLPIILEYTRGEIEYTLSIDFLPRSNRF